MRYELKRVRKENAKLKEERAILKKAAAFFAKVLWQYMMGDCEPGFEFSEMAVGAMQSCGASCLNPINWIGQGRRSSTKARAFESWGRGKKDNNSIQAVDFSSELTVSANSARRHLR